MKCGICSCPKRTDEYKLAGTIHRCLNCDPLTGPALPAQTPPSAPSTGDSPK